MMMKIIVLLTFLNDLIIIIINLEETMITAATTKLT